MLDAEVDRVLQSTPPVSNTNIGKPVVLARNLIEVLSDDKILCCHGQDHAE